MTNFFKSRKMKKVTKNESCKVITKIGLSAVFVSGSLRISEYSIIFLLLKLFQMFLFYILNLFVFLNRR